MIVVFISLNGDMIRRDVTDHDDIGELIERWSTEQSCSYPATLQVMRTQRCLSKFQRGIVASSVLVHGDLLEEVLN
jgi:hypothetical protein